MIGIHEVHRRLALVTYNNMDINGNLTLGWAEMRALMPLLKQNLELVQRMDELKHLSMVAYEVGDNEWLMDVCRKIEDLESTML